MLEIFYDLEIYFSYHFLTRDIATTTTTTTIAKIYSTATAKTYSTTNTAKDKNAPATYLYP